MEIDLKKIIAIKKALAEAGIDAKNIAYVPAMPIPTPFSKEFIVGEIMGVRVLTLISAPDED